MLQHSSTGRLLLVVMALITLGGCASTNPAFLSPTIPADGGVGLTRISQWFSAPNSAHADHHVIVAHPGFNGTSNTTVFFGNDGGLYRADDLLRRYVTLVYAQTGNYQETARRLLLDRRTVQARIDRPFLERLRQGL